MSAVVIGQNQSFYSLYVDLASLVFQDSAADSEIAALRGVIHDKESMCNYCAGKLDRHIG